MIGLWSSQPRHYVLILRKSKFLLFLIGFLSFVLQIYINIMKKEKLLLFVMHLFFILSQHLQTQYDEFFPALCNDHPDIFPRELYTWEQFLWACELWYSNSMKVMFPDGKLRTCLIPIAGFLNHSVRHSFLSVHLYFSFCSHVFCLHG